MIIEEKQKLIIVGVVGLLAGFGIGYYTGYHFGSLTKTAVVTMPQSQAEKPEKIKEAAAKVGILLDKGQSKEVAQGIAQKVNEKPYKAVTTTVKEAPKVIEQEQKLSKANFSIVTNPTDQDKVVDFRDYATTDSLTLNQYNITAYKKQLHSISYYPKSDGKPAMIGADYSVRVSNSGKYLGVATAYNWDSKRVYIGVQYTF